jgi:hypothetical protein
MGDESHFDTCMILAFRSHNRNMKTSTNPGMAGTTGYIDIISGMNTRGLITTTKFTLCGIFFL